MISALGVEGTIHREQLAGCVPLLTLGSQAARVPLPPQKVLGGATFSVTILNS